MSTKPQAQNLLLPAAISTLENGNPGKARDICIQILSSDDSNPEVLQVLGLADYYLGKTDDALAALKKSFSADPTNDSVANNIASILQEQDRLDDALSYARKAINLEPGNAQAINNLGLIYRKLGDLEEAETTFLEALSLDAENPRILTNLGEVLLKKQKLTDAQDKFQAALEQEPDFAAAKNNLGVIFQKTGKLDEALILFNDLLTQFPKDADILNNIGLVYEKKKEIRKAIQYYQMAIDTNRFHTNAYINLASLYSELGDFEKALNICNQLYKVDPNSVEMHKKLAQIYKEQEKPKLAFREIMRAQELAPNEVEVYLVYASILEQFGKIEEANDMLKKAIELSPGSDEVYLKWAEFSERAHKLDQAHQLLDQIRATDSNVRNEKAVIRATLLRREDKLHEALEQLRIIKNPELLTPNVETKYLRENAKIMDKLGQFDEAFEYYQRAAELQKTDKNLGYDAENSRSLIDEQIAFFSKQMLSRIPGIQESVRGSEPTPIFIVGFPRSGTTLVEQILCSHSNIVAGGELTAIGELVKIAPNDLGASRSYPFCLEKLCEIPDPQRLLENWRDYYFDRAKEVGVLKNGAKYFTDKMPLNLIYLPLIKALFPESPIIHMMRNPMDSVMSSVFSGFAQRMIWAHDLEDAAYYFIDTYTLSRHFITNTDMKYLMVRYEDLVSDQEYWSRKLIDFTGEQWEDSCMDFYKTQRVSRTASYEQVTKKIYTSSVARYRNYEKFLSKPLEILNPVMDSLGYLQSSKN